ncbi:venom protease-like [Zophobas morio]|uniref:venom protease-like n=1 Tax=Zophobas morio TaxID=2755281 RepID=UPI00308295B5
MFKFLFIIFAISVHNIYTEDIIGNACTLNASNSPGTCKLLTECEEIQDEVAFGHEVPQTCGFQGTQSVVCCPKSRRPGYISEKKCREYASSPQETQFRGHKIVKRVVGGEPAGRKEFPHMAILGYQTGDPDEGPWWVCGGSLISEQYILTAAQCMFGGNPDAPNFVLLGVTNLNDTNHRQEIKIVSKVVHPEYKTSSHYHDIALVKLEKPVEINSYARPACLQTKFEIPAIKTIATGWGTTGVGGEPSENLLKVTLDIVDYQICKNTYKTTRNLKNGIIDDTQICTGGDDGQDTCQGDAGGPLQIHQNNDLIQRIYHIVGVTSFGIGCGSRPAVNTRVSYYIKWIEDTVWPENNQ